MNNVTLIGRLTRDPELRYMAESGNANCTFTLAVDRGLSREKRQEMEAKGQPTADFIRIVAWGKTAELCGNYLQKGLQTAVQGRIQTGSYVNQQGQRVYTTDVVAERVHFIEWPDSPRNQGFQNQGFNQAYGGSSFSQDTGFNQDGGFNQMGGFNQDIGSDDDNDFIPYQGDDDELPF